MNLGSEPFPAVSQPRSRCARAAAILTSVLVGLGDLCELLNLFGTVLELVWTFPLLACTEPFPDYLHNLLVHHPAQEMSMNATTAK